MLQIKQDSKWFIKTFCYFAITTHVIACTWIIAGKLDPNQEESWLLGYLMLGKSEVYL